MVFDFFLFKIFFILHLHISSRLVSSLLSTMAHFHFHFFPVPFFPFFPLRVFVYGDWEFGGEGGGIEM